LYGADELEEDRRTLERLGIVVSDSSPRLHCPELGRLALLASFYERILIPAEVQHEVTEVGRGLPGAEEVRNAKMKLMNLKRVRVVFLAYVVGVLAAILSFANQNTLPAREPGEGLWRPGEIQIPGKVTSAFAGLVRIPSHNMRFQLTLFQTEQAASAARKLPHARDKEYKEDGSLLWPVLMARPDLEKTCSVKSATLSPGIYELCQALQKSKCDAYPCKITTEALASAAGGVAVSRLNDGTVVILTAYHVARESIERNHRTAGQYTISPVATKELSIEYSHDSSQSPASYRVIQDTYLLANASEEDWRKGKDWALLGVPGSEAPGLKTVPLATQWPKEGDPIWVLGFPFRTERSTAKVVGYRDADGDFRVSYGLAMGLEDLGTRPPYVITNADMVSGNSGGPLINSEGEVVGIVHNSLCKPDGEIDLSTVKFCGVTLATSFDALGNVLSN
jgi:hypothetical protein